MKVIPASLVELHRPWIQEESDANEVTFEHMDEGSSGRISNEDMAETRHPVCMTLGYVQPLLQRD